MFHRARHARARRGFLRQRRRRLTQVMITVHLAADPRSTIYGHRPGDPYLLADRFLLDRLGDTDDFAVLDRVFAALNDHPHPADVEHTRRWYRHGHRSLSVGDIVTIDQRRYACTPWSWDTLPTD